MSGALVDQQNQVVYYTAQLNDIQFKAIKQYANTSDELSKNSKNPNVGYPAGALEVKGAWRIAQLTVDGNTKTYIPNAGRRFITFQDIVAPIKWTKQSDGSFAPSTDTNAKGMPAVLALVGFHIVGRDNKSPGVHLGNF